MSPLRKLTYFIKLVILDKIFIFLNSVMPGHQLVEKMKISPKETFLIVSVFGVDSPILIT